MQVLRTPRCQGRTHPFFEKSRICKLRYMSELQNALVKTHGQMWPELWPHLATSVRNPELLVDMDEQIDIALQIQ